MSQEKRMRPWAGATPGWLALGRRPPRDERTAQEPFGECLSSTARE